MGYADRFTGAGFGMNAGADLHVPLDHNATYQLQKQSASLNDVPKFNSIDGGISKAERVREWCGTVEDKLAVLHPIFKEF